jgi:protein-S-isoprenylcysteine O-methyltransferase Ste14
MSDGFTPRAVLIVVMLLLLPIGMYHRVKSQSTREALDRRQEGIFILATLRPLGAALWLGVIAWMINPAWMAWSSVRVPLWSVWAGVPFLLAGAALLVWTFRSLGKNLTDTVVTRKQHTLVSHGPYRWIRHPLYSSAALLVVALSLVAANWFFFVAGMALLCLLVVRTRTEEANLVARFGDSYRQYMKRTGRFVPKLG